MKKEEAIKLLNDIHSQCCDTANILCTLDADKRCDALQLAITALQNQPVWIPVSERLPEKSYGCLATVMDFEPLTQTDFENILPYFVGYDGHGWNNADGETIPFEVIAWMPLPEPYRESEPHKQTKADEIRSMTDEELAAFIINFDNRFGEEYEGEQSCLSWLQKESEE